MEVGLRAGVGAARCALAQWRAAHAAGPEPAAPGGACPARTGLRVRRVCLDRLPRCRSVDLELHPPRARWIVGGGDPQLHTGTAIQLPHWASLGRALER